MEANLEELISIIKSRAPVLCPQVRPLLSDVSSDDVHMCLAGMFAEKHQSTVLKSLASRQKKSDQTTGRKTVLVMDCDISVTKRQITVKKLEFVSEIEAVLYNTKKFVQMLVEDKDDLHLFTNHFRLKNGYDDDEVEPYVVQEVYSAAYSLQVLVDSVPDWETRLLFAGGAKHSVPLSKNVDVEAVLAALFQE
jgi:hypothetical protein